MRPQPLIAVVDDDTVFLSMVDEMLADEGYTTVLWSHVEGASETICTRQPNLVILDIWFGTEAAGWTILHEMRLDTTTKHIPVLIVTADPIQLQRHRDRLREYNAESLAKPFDLIDFLAKVRNLLRIPPPGSKSILVDPGFDASPRQGTSGNLDHRHLIGARFSCGIYPVTGYIQNRAADEPLIGSRPQSLVSPTAPTSGHATRG